MAEERGDHRCHKHVSVFDQGGWLNAPLIECRNDTDQPEPVATPKES